MPASHIDLIVNQLCRHPFTTAGRARARRRKTCGHHPRNLPRSASHTGLAIDQSKKRVCAVHVANVAHVDDDTGLARWRWRSCQGTPVNTQLQPLRMRVVGQEFNPSWKLVFPDLEVAVGAARGLPGRCKRCRRQRGSTPTPCRVASGSRHTRAAFGTSAATQKRAGEQGRRRGGRRPQAARVCTLCTHAATMIEPAESS